MISFITSFLFTFILSSSIAQASEIENRIIQNIQNNSISIIGENHHRPESVRFFESIINNYLKDNNCLTVALEIASSQQSTIDLFVDGRINVEAIKIPPMIDHADYRTMLTNLANMKRGGVCINIIAIDADGKTMTRRDEWMVKVIENQNKTRPILALLGNLHALKKVDWSVDGPLPYFAELLTLSGHDIRTYHQIWKDKTCSSYKTKWVSPDSNEATMLINSSLIALLNAFESDSVEKVTDGLILWECS